MIQTAKELIAEATRHIETVSADDVADLLNDPTVVFVDLREQDELKSEGRLERAIHVPRGLLEFQIDPTSQLHNPKLGGAKKLVLFCSRGGRSALAAKSLKDMGFDNVVHVASGFAALKQEFDPALFTMNA